MTVSPSARVAAAGAAFPGAAARLCCCRCCCCCEETVHSMPSCCMATLQITQPGPAPQQQHSKQCEAAADPFDCVLMSGTRSNLSDAASVFTSLLTWHRNPSEHMNHIAWHIAVRVLWALCLAQTWRAQLLRSWYTAVSAACKLVSDRALVSCISEMYIAALHMQLNRQLPVAAHQTCAAFIVAVTCCCHSAAVLALQQCKQSRWAQTV